MSWMKKDKWDKHQDSNSVQYRPNGVLQLCEVVVSVLVVKAPHK